MTMRVNPAPANPGRAVHFANSEKQYAEDLLWFSAIAMLVFSDTSHGQLMMKIEHCPQQLVLALEVIIQAALRDPRVRSNLIDPDPAVSLSVEQLIGRVEDATPGLSRRSGHGAC